jgi:sec-independent protein translocase protein TatC
VSASGIRKDEDDLPTEENALAAAASSSVSPPLETLEPDAILEGGGGDGPSDGDPPMSPEEAELDGKRMSLLEHLSELRVRLRNAAIAFVVAMLASFYFVARFFEILTRPVRTGMIKAGFKPEMVVGGVTEVFWVYMKLAIIAGVIIASPLVFWELWKFVAPGLYKKERKLATLVTGSTAFCFMAGAVFGYFVLCEPAAYYMMSMLKNEGMVSRVPLDLRPMLRMDEVADFLMLTLAGCGAAFELPVIVAALGFLGLVSSKALWKFNKYALVLAFVLGAVLTPSTDPFTQTLLAGPLLALYEVSIGVVWLIERGRKRTEDELEKEYDADKP